MVQLLLAPIALRPRRNRLAVWAAVAAVVLVASGCGGHRRQSMRPVYLSPAPVGVSAPAGCPTGVEPSAAAPTTSTTVVPSLVDPGAAPASGAPLGSSPGLTNPLPDSPPPLTPPSAQGQRPGPSGEPPLDLNPADRNSGVSPPRNNNTRGGAAPGSSMNNDGGAPPAKGRRTASGRLRQASLRERVRPFVNDPDDLFAPPKADRPWKYVVLHHSAAASGGYASIDREHRKRLGWDGCGYHFVIGNGSETPDGQIEVAQRWASQKHGVHCRDGKSPDVNEYGIGICLVGDLESTPPTERQVAAARALVAYLCERYQIPAERTETHAHLAATPTPCPGRHFPAREILGSRGLALLETDR